MTSRGFVCLSAACCILCSLASAGWHGVYHDGPIAVTLKAERPQYSAGDTFRVVITATNTSDRPVLLRKNWREQVVFYHLQPRTGEQVEWPGRVNTATWLDSSDVVRLGPESSYSVGPRVRVFGPDDAAAFDFRVKLCGVKDYGRRYTTWQGVAWSNSIRVTVKSR